MIEKGWSWSTFLLYIILALLITFLSRLSVDAKIKDKKIHIKNYQLKVKYIYYFLIYVIFIIFSCFRVVTSEIGGADTLHYMEQFQEITYTKFFTLDNLFMNSYEYFYYNLMYLIKILGGNYIHFEYCIYSGIILAYIYMIDKNFKDVKETNLVILFFIPLLRSLNIIRNCFAAAIGFISIDKIKENKILGAIIFMLIAFLSHYIAIILFVFLIFYKCFPDKYVNKKTSLILPAICAFLSIVGFPLMKFLIKNSGFVGYLNKIEISLWGYIPVIILYLIMFLDDNFLKYVKKNQHYVFYKCHLFMISILPLAIRINAAYRLVLFFEIPKYILYADLYLYYRDKKIIKNKKMFDILVFMGLIIWLAFRIYRMYDSNYIMPYKNYLFE